MQRRQALIAIYVLLALGAALLSYLAHLYPHFPGDVELARWVQGLDFPGLGLGMEAVSRLGGGPVAALVALGCLIGLYLAGYAAPSLWLLAGAASGYLLNLILKLLVDRPRPAISAESSFPSGHAMHSIIFYGFLLYLASAIKSRRLRLPTQVALAVVILVQGPSRVYLGAHWPSDVASGYLIGGLLLWAVISAYRRWGQRLPPWPSRRGRT